MQYSISQDRISEIVDTLTARHQIDKVILFGSQFRGDADKDSDLDLFLIMPFEGNRRKLMVEMRDLFDNVRHGIDILVSKPDEYEEDKMIPGTLARQVFLEGRVLYDKSARMKRRGAEYLAQLLSNMSSQEQLDFWAERTKKLLATQDTTRGISPKKDMISNASTETGDGSFRGRKWLTLFFGGNEFSLDASSWE